MVIALILLAVGVGVAGWMWRINLAINHPEKNKRLEELEAKLRKQRAEALEKIMAGARKGIAIGMKYRRRFKK